MPLTSDVRSLRVREARPDDLAAIRRIYNEGIEDRVATLDSDPKSDDEILEWFAAHGGRYSVVVAERDDALVGWASLNPYSHRCAYAGVADLSVYVARDARGSGVGTTLLSAIETSARQHEFHKIVLFALTGNEPGLRLYRKAGFREVGVFREQGRLDGRPVDVVAMERLLPEVV
jgi:L-amino acid N-acyltransferase YncA